MTAPDPDTIRARILSALLAPTWTAADLQRLAALVALGPPSAMHASAPDAPGASATGPGDVREVWREGESDRVRAHVLAMWRDVARSCGVPLPPPGKVE